MSRNKRIGDCSMTPFRVTLALVLVMVAVLLAAGCSAGTDDNGKKIPEPIISVTQNATNQSVIDQIGNNSSWIILDPIGDRHVGENISITSWTNLPVTDKIHFIVSTSYLPLCPKKGCSFTDPTGTLDIVQDETGQNKTIFYINTTVMRPDEYIVSESENTKNVSGFVIFRLLDKHWVPT